MSLTFRFPMPANLANSRMHHMVKHRQKVAYWNHLDILVSGKILPPPPVPAFPTATVTSRMTLGAHMDDDNAMARHKWVLDWLVTRGYVAGDTRKHLKWSGLPTQHVTRKNEPVIELTLETAS